MGSNMQRQAVVSVKPEAPYVSTGEEEKVALDSGYVVVAEEDGTVLEADGTHIRVKYGRTTKNYLLGKIQTVKPIYLHFATAARRRGRRR